MVTIYLVRHGNTEHNQQEIIMGQIDSPLTDKGINTATLMAKRLKNISFDKVFSSDLGRAFITAHIIVEKLNIEEKLLRAKELREINYGSLANRKKSEMSEKYPQYKTDATFIFPNGESFATVQKRVVQFIKTLEDDYANKTILLVTHAGVIRVIISHFKRENLQNHLTTDVPHEYLGKLVVEKGKLRSYEQKIL